MKTLVFSMTILFALAGFAQTSTTKAPKGKSVLSKLMETPSAKAEAKKSKASQASAQGISTQAMPKDDWAPAWMVNHASVGFVLTTAHELKNMNFDAFGRHGAGTGDVDGGFGVTVQYKGAIVPQWNYAASLSALQSKEIGSFSGSIQDQHRNLAFDSKPSFQPWVLAANAEYRLNDAVYFPFGLNTSIYNETHTGDFETFSMEPQLGYQLGAGATVEKNFGIELVWQSLRYYVDGKAFDKHVSMEGYANLEGLNLQGRYTF